MHECTTVQGQIALDRESSTCHDLMLRSPKENWRPYYSVEATDIAPNHTKFECASFEGFPAIVVHNSELSMCDCNSDLCCNDIIAHVPQHIIDGIRARNLALLATGKRTVCGTLYGNCVNENGFVM